MNNSIMIEHAELVHRWKNFSGEKDPNFNPNGDKVFSIFIDDPELAQQMADEGYRVRIYKSKNDPDAPIRHTLKIKVSYRFDAPEVIRIVDGVEHYLTEETIGQLDNDRIIDALVMFYPSKSSKYGGNLATAYLKKLVVVVDPTYVEPKRYDDERFSDAYRRMVSPDEE